MILNTNLQVVRSRSDEDNGGEDDVGSRWRDVTLGISVADEEGNSLEGALVDAGVAKFGDSILPSPKTSRFVRSQSADDVQLFLDAADNDDDDLLRRTPSLFERPVDHDAANRRNDVFDDALSKPLNLPFNASATSGGRQNLEDFFDSPSPLSSVPTSVFVERFRSPESSGDEAGTGRTDEQTIERIDDRSASQQPESQKPIGDTDMKNDWKAAKNVYRSDTEAGRLSLPQHGGMEVCSFWRKVSVNFRVRNGGSDRRLI